MLAGVSLFFGVVAGMRWEFVSFFYALELMLLRIFRFIRVLSCVEMV